MHAKITEYKGHLVCELIASASIKGEVRTSIDTKGVIGQVIMNTEKNLGVSPEALELMKNVKIGHDDLGDIDWFETTIGGTFSWLGGPYAIKLPGDIETTRDFKILKHVVIPNDTPQGAKDTIDNSESS